MNWLMLIVAGLFEVVWATVLSPATFRLACWIDATRKSNNAPDEESKIDYPPIENRALT